VCKKVKAGKKVNKLLKLFEEATHLFCVDVWHDLPQPLKSVIETVHPLPLPGVGHVAPVLHYDRGRRVQVLLPATLALLLAGGVRVGVRLSRRGLRGEYKERISEEILRNLRGNLKGKSVGNLILMWQPVYTMPRWRY
jgi:hypothetical protein